jgi:LysM repeat protein
MRIKSFAYFILLSAIFLWHDVTYSQTKSQDGLDYIEKYHKIAMREMQEYKIPASITLAQGILESGNGKSELAKKSNNHFGIKCHKNWTGKRTYHDDDEKGECFRVYDDPAQSYRDHSLFLTNGQRYAFLFDLEITDYKGWAKGLKQAGYATLPVYANVLINLIETYDLTQYDQMALKGPKIDLKENNAKDKVADNKKDKDKDKKSVSEIRSPYMLNEAEVVDKLFDGRYVRENNGVKFIYAKEGDDVYKLAHGMEIYDYQLIKYNNLGKRRTFSENEVIYIEPKKNKASKKYKYHTIQKGETLSYVSRLYAVKLKSIFKMNDMDENTVLQIGDKIRLR